MIQRCPNCGQWCEAGKDGILDRAVGGWAETVVNDSETGKSLAGGVGEFVGSAFGFYRGIVKGATDAVFGEKYNFVCPECGCEWSTDDEADDETEEYQYEQELKEKVNELSHLVSDYCDKSDGEQQRFIQELRSTLEEVSGYSDLTAIIYDTLSAAHFLFYEDCARAQDYINKSLGLYDDPKSKVLRGIYRSDCRGALDFYNKLTDLQCYEPEASVFLNDEYICAERDKTLSMCRDHFLEIPYSDRKFLMVVPTLDDIPQGSMGGRAVKVLPQAYVPSELQILGGVLQQNVVYVCHPYLQNSYIQFENFDQELLKDQVNELLIFLGGLGAKSIQIIDTASDSSEGRMESNLSGKVGGKYKGMGGSVSGEMECKSSVSEYLAKALNVGSQFEQQSAIQIIESGWFKGNKDWQDMARLRQLGHTHYNLNVSSSSSRYVSDSDLKQLSADFDVLVCSGEAEVKKTSSHEFKRSEEHSWTLGVEFYPLSSYNKKEEVISAAALPVSSEKKGLNKVYIAFICVIVLLLGLIAWLLAK